MKALRLLDVPATPIASVEPLQGLRALRTLDLSGTAVTDIKPLQGLPALSRLDLRSTAVSPEEIDSFIKARAAMGLQAVEILR